MFRSFKIRHVSLVLLSAFAALSLFATNIEAKANVGTSAPAIWKLSDEDSEIWLFGTVHILNPTLQWRNEQISEAFSAADTLITEADVHDIAPSAMQALVMKHGLNPSGASFLNKLSPEARTNFEKVVMSLGMPAEGINQFAPYRPWLAGITVQALKIQSMGGDPEAGVDKLLWKEAKATGKTLAYLETAEEQMSFFGNMTATDELFFFEEGMRQMLEDPDMMDQIVSDWQTGSVESLGTKMQAAMVGQETLYDVLLTNRNRNWAAQIKEMMDGSGKVFIAVGAAHLAGKDSVQSILKNNYGLVAIRQ